MSSRNRFNISWLIAEKLLRVLVGGFVTAAVARHLGPESYGTLAISIGIVSIAVAAANMGADHVHVSEFSQLQGTASAAFLASALLVRVVWSIICLALLWCAIALLNVNQRTVLLILSAAIPISAFTIFAGKMQGQGSFGAFSILSCTSIALGASLRVFGIYLGASIEFFATVFIAEGSCLAVLLLGWYQRKASTSIARLCPSRELVSSYLKLCLPTAVSATLMVLYLRFELFLVDALIGKAAAGMWSAALMFTVPWGIVAGSIMPVANRRLAVALGDGIDYGHKLVKLLRWMILLALAAALSNCLAVAVVAPLLLGPKFAGVETIVFITSFSFIPLFSGTVQELWIAHQRSTGTVLKKVLIGLPVSAALFYFIVQTYGLRGAAVAMVLSYFFTAFLLNALLDKSFFKIQLRAMGFKYA